jgi:hypothetical protein
MARPLEAIVSFVCQTGAGYVGPNERAVLLTIGRSDEESQPTFAFRPERARSVARELLDCADRAESQDPTQN